MTPLAIPAVVVALMSSAESPSADRTKEEAKRPMTKEEFAARAKEGPLPRKLKD